MMTTTRLDTSGLNCPIPILKAKKAIGSVKDGELLEVIATDPGAHEDFVAFCRATGHTLEAASEEDGVLRFLIRRRG